LLTVRASRTAATESLSRTQQWLPAFAMPHPARVAGWIAIIIAAAVLVIWSGGAADPTQFSPLVGRMNPTTAVCVVLLGAATLAPRRPRSWQTSLIKPVLGCIVTLIAAIKLLGGIIHHDYGIDYLFVAERTMVSGHAIVAPHTALCLILLSVAIPCAASRVHVAARLAQLLACFVSFIAGTVLIGHLFGATSGFGYPAFGGMAAATAAALLCLVVGVLFARPNKFITGVFTNGELGGITARRLLWLILPTTLFLGQLRIISLRYNLVDNVTGISLLTASLLAVMIVVVVIACNELRVNAKRERVSRAARDKSEAANQAKSDFLATMSHEIRTPLTAVIGFAQLLMDNDLAPEPRHNALRCQEAAQSLLAIVNDILDLSKIEAGKLEIERVPLNPAVVIYSAASIVASKAKGKGLDIEVDLASDLPRWVEGDPARLLQILLNLVSNAIKFTRAGNIRIACHREFRGGGFVLLFEVHDPGLGISKENQALLFQSFAQVDRSTTRRNSGTGLGLAISKRLVEAMGGDINVSSEVGLGSTFWFTTPLVECNAPDEAVQRPGAAKTTSPSRILIAEDVVPIQEILCAMLRAAGHVVDATRDGQEALEALQRSHYDIVLMDMEMPNMDGISAARAIRRLDGHESNVPIIALTANASLEDSLRCRAAGMNDFISKPIQRAELVGVVARWTGAPSARKIANKPAEITELDHAMLRELESLLGIDGTARLSAEFLAELESEVAALSDPDRISVAHHAHRLAGSAGQLGCVELSDLSQKLCLALRDDAPTAETIAAEIAVAAKRAAVALRRRYTV
jgi:signal transduction histidine kinase/DNA-binding NarL/FixJ family response regulator